MKWAAEGNGWFFDIYTALVNNAMVEHTLCIMYFHFGQQSASSSHSLYHLQAAAKYCKHLAFQKKTYVHTSTDLLRHFDSLSFSLTHLQSLSLNDLPTHLHTAFQSPTHPPTYILSLSHSHAYSLSLSVSHLPILHTVFQSLTHLHIHPYTFSLSLSLPQSHTYSLYLSLSHSHLPILHTVFQSLTHLHIHPHTLCISLSHIQSLSFSLSHPPIHPHSISASLTHTHTLTVIQSLTHPSIHIQASISLTSVQTNMSLLPTTTTPKHSEICEVSFLTATQFIQTQRGKVIRPELQPPHGPLAATPDWSVSTTPSVTWHPTGVMLCSPQTRACPQRLMADPQCHQQEEKSLSAHCCGHHCLHRCCHQGLEHQIQPSHCHRQQYQGWGAAMVFSGSMAVLHLFHHFWENLLLKLLWLSVSLISKRKNRDRQKHTI